MDTNQPITEAALAELDRLKSEAHPGEWRRFGKEEYIYSSVGAVFRRPFKYLDGFKKWAQNSAWCCAIHNAYPALRERLRLAEAERDKLRTTVAQHNALAPLIALADQTLAARDARMKREGAIEAFNEMRRQANEVGKQSGLAKKMCRIFADECIEQAAKLRDKNNG